MAAITKATLRNRVLQHIGVLAAGETATGADADLVDGYIETVFEELDKIGTVESGFTSNSIPDWAQNAFRDRVSFLVAPAFGLPLDRVRTLAELAVPALQVLIRHQQAYTGHDSSTDLSHKVLQRLGVIQQGEDAPAAHLQTVDEVSAAFIDWLDELGTLQSGWTTLDTTPEWAEPYMAAAIAYRASGLFGVVDQTIVGQLRAEYDEAVNEIVRRFTAISPANTKVEVANDIAQKLGLVRPGEEPSTPLLDDIQDGIDQFQDWIDELGTAGTGFTDVTSLAAWAKPLYRDIVAARMMAQLGVTDATMVQVVAAEGSAAQDELLKRMAALAESDSSNDLRNKVAAFLGLVPQGSVPTGPEAETIDDVAASVLDWLQEFGTLPDSWTTLDSTPVWAETFMRDIVASRAAELLGIRDAGFIQILKAKEEVGIREIFQRLSAPTGATNILLRNAVADKLGLTMPGQTPTAAQAALIDAGIAWWFDLADEKGTVGFASDAIPNWAETYIRDIVAERVAAPLGVRDPVILAQLSRDAAIGALEVEKRFTALGESATKTILRNMILRKLGVIGVAEDPSAAQIEIAEELLDKLFSQLRADRTVTFTTAAIPDWAMVPLRDYMTYMFTETFRVAPSQTLYLQHRQGLKELRSQVTMQAPLTTTSIEARYY